MTDAPLLQAKNLRLGYGRGDVVHDVDLTLTPGAITTLIGANGAGKTTILRALSGLLAPRAGSIAWRGEAIAGLPAHKIAALGLAHVPEGRQVFAGLSVAQNLAMGAWLSRDGAREKRLREAALARFPRLAERLDQPAGLLSGGEQQMLAIARALMSDPPALLLDEPSMGLAPLFVEDIFRMVASLKAEGRAILLVEQNARGALAIADDAIVLQSGRVTLRGPAAEIAADEAVVKAYLGGA